LTGAVHFSFNGREGSVKIPPRVKFMFLLKTKLAIPPLRADLVSRPRLLKKLDEGKGKKLLLLSAPPGFGKTTLLSEWIHKKKIQAAWFSIDEKDNDPISFLTYIIAALQTVNADWGQPALDLIQSPQRTMWESTIIALINSLIPIQKNIVFVLDDYHLIQSTSIHDMLGFLLDALPPEIQLILATRSDPPLPLSRIRTKNQLTELRTADLSFTTEETMQYFRDKLNVDLSIEDIALLESRTEGWITGLQLAALSMQGRKSLTSFVADFSGDNRYIMDYLMEEVLNRLPEDIRIFLRQTSILDPLSGSLCDAVTERKNSQQILNMLEKSNLFISPLDHERKWFRYHRLFADSLNQNLHHKHKETIPELHRRASDWYDKNGLKSEAVDHALAAQDYENAISLLEEMMETVWDRGQQVKLARWFGLLPRRLISRRPQLCVFYARSLIMSGRQKEAEDCLTSAEQILESSSEDLVEILPDGTRFQHSFNREEMLGKISAVRALLAMYQGDVANVIEHAYHALVLLSDENLTWRGVVETMLGMAHGWAGDGDMRKAEKAFSSALSIIKKEKNISFYLFAGLALAGVYTYQGRMQEAENFCRKLLQTARDSGMSQTGNAASIHSILGGILCEKDDLENGIPMIRKGLELAKLSHDLIALQGVRLNWIRVLILIKDFPRALRFIDEMLKDSKNIDLPPWMDHVVAAYQARIWMELGHADLLSRWIDERGISTQDRLTCRSEPEHVVLARILNSQDRPEEADKFLKKLIKNALEGTRVASAIEMHLVRTKALYAQAKIDETIEALKGALALGEKGCFIHVFTMEGKLMARLLAKVMEDNKRTKTELGPPCSAAYIEKILKAFEETKIPPKMAGTGEDISDREIEVLHLITEGYSNQEIAEKLFISLNTVRTHTKNINSKLDVHSRMQAAARAKKLGLF
jgi:LuxR family maltose regulon positive regulatory protein